MSPNFVAFAPALGVADGWSATLRVLSSSYVSKYTVVLHRLGVEHRIVGFGLPDQEASSLKKLEFAVQEWIEECKMALPPHSPLHTPK